MSTHTDELRALADLHGTGEPGDPWGHVERLSGEVDAEVARLRRERDAALEHHRRGVANLGESLSARTRERDALAAALRLAYYDEAKRWWVIRKEDLLAHLDRPGRELLIDLLTARAALSPAPAAPFCRDCKGRHHYGEECGGPAPAEPEDPTARNQDGSPYLGTSGGIKAADETDGMAGPVEEAPDAD